MDFDAVPASLRDRLGAEATGGLLSLFDLARSEWKADLIAASTERYERRLSEEMARARVQAAQVEASLRTEIAQMGASIRQDMAQMGASIRQDMTQMGASIRQDMAQMGASIRNDMATGRVELFKWCFIFWIGQVLAIAGIIGVMLRLFRP
jgi:hypothetical protein